MSREPVRIVHFAIRVKEHEDLSATCLDPAVPREGRTAIFDVLHDPDRRKLLERAQRAIGGRIVHHNNLEIRIGLADHAVEASANKRLTVVAGDDHRD